MTEQRLHEIECAFDPSDGFSTVGYMEECFAAIRALQSELASLTTRETLPTHDQLRIQKLEKELASLKSEQGKGLTTEQQQFLDRCRRTLDPTTKFSSIHLLLEIIDSLSAKKGVEAKAVGSYPAPMPIETAPTGRDVKWFRAFRTLTGMWIDVFWEPGHTRLATDIKTSWDVTEFSHWLPMTPDPPRVGTSPLAGNSTQPPAEQENSLLSTSEELTRDSELGSAKEGGDSSSQGGR